MNSITDEDRKKASLLSLIGADTYRTLYSLLVPGAPKDYTYEKKLAEHFAPRRSQIYYHSEFYRSKRKPNMSVAAVAEFMSQLRSLAIDCGFGDQLWH